MATPTATPLRRRSDVGGAYTIEQIEFADGAGIDAFGRIRVSNPETLFDSQLEYDISPIFWYTTLVGGGTTTHVPGGSAIDLDVGTASGDKVSRQTKSYFRYQSGKSQKIEMTAVFDTAKTNQEQAIGYFDDDNGVFFQTKAGVVNTVLRSKVTGSVVDTEVAQTDWEIDTLDGSSDSNNPSGIELIPTNNQIFVIDLEWLSTGRVRVGFRIMGVIVYVHEFLNSNVSTTAYMTTANLPLRYEIENTGTVASASTLTQICGSVISEGGFAFEYGIPYSTSNGTTTIAVTTRRPILSIRPKATFNSIVNRASITAQLVTVLANTNRAFVEVVYDGTLTGGTFAVDPAGVAEADVEATAISGGIVIASFYVSTTGAGATQAGAGRNPISSRLPLTLDPAGANPINLSVVVTSMSATANVGATIDWAELRG